MTQPDFSAFNKNAAKSFADQRNLIKNVCRGKTVLCRVCGQPLKLVAPGKKPTDKKTGVSCDKGCTHIELEFGG